MSKDQELIELGNAQVEMRATVESDDTLRWWLLGFGSQVEVLEPHDLREDLRAELYRAGQRYGQSPKKECSDNKPGQ